jgi:hypothetical protein
MVRTTLAAALLAALAAASPAIAADWKPAGKTFSGNDVYVDAAATRAIGDVRTTWVRVVYVRPFEIPGGNARSMEALAHFDCRTHASAGISVVFYAEPAGGRILLFSHEETVRFDPDPAGSFGEIARKALCG